MSYDDETAAQRDLRTETDRNGNLWAWWVPDGVDPAIPALAVRKNVDALQSQLLDGPSQFLQGRLAPERRHRCKSCKPLRMLADHPGT